MQQQLQLERGVRACERSSSADTKVRGEKWEEVLWAPELRFPAACGADHDEAAVLQGGGDTQL